MSSPYRHVVVLNRSDQGLSAHDIATVEGVAKRLAHLIGASYSSSYSASANYEGSLYFVPSDVLLRDEADRYGIAGENTLFGGIVPYAFVGTKAVTHGAVSAEARVPAGWSHRLSGDLNSLVLPGFSVFSKTDAVAGARTLLKKGRVRIKPAWARGGVDQAVAESIADVGDVLARLDPELLARQGVVLEQDLERTTTYGVGEIRIAGRALAYYGVQRRVQKRDGNEVYAGSDLIAVRGTLRDLEAVIGAREIRTAVRQARLYDEALQAAFPGLMASRRNYDVIRGYDESGRILSGVMEQSWRVGGASPAEVAALQMFERSPGVQRVRASSYEVYSGEPPPSHADVYFRDPVCVNGPLAKYCVVEPDAHQP